MIPTLLLVACEAEPPAADPGRRVGPDPDTASLGPPIVPAEPPEPAGTSPGPSPPSDFPVLAGGPLELCVNEFMPDNTVSAVDDAGVASDWVELHNPGDGPVSLAGWSMTDDPAEPGKHHLDASLVVEAGGFLVLWADHRADLGPTHLGFALSDGGEAIALYAPDGDGSIVWFGPVASDLAIARATDCCDDGCFGYVFAGTPGGTNELTDSGP